MTCGISNFTVDNAGQNDKQDSAPDSTQEAMQDTMQDALRLLTYRPRSVHELTVRLRNKNYPEESISEVVAKLESWGYLNDAKFTEDWIRNRLQNKPMGSIRLRSELRAKGVSSEIINEKLKDAFAETSEFEVAYTLVISKLGSPGEQMSAEDWNRLAGLLKRRGFSYETVASVGAALRLGYS